jgi:hypothetical protein
MNDTVEILKALVALVDQGTFNVNTKGATEIATIRQAAGQKIEELMQPPLEGTAKEDFEEDGEDEGGY